MTRHSHVKMHIAPWAAVGMYAVLSLCFSCTRKAGTGTATAADTVAHCRALVQEARLAMESQQPQKALLKLDSCIRATTANPKSNDSLAPVVANALVMLNNTYQGMAQPEACIARLEDYARHPSPILEKQCRRDLAVVTAYALSRTEKTAEAARLMDKALAIAPHDESHSRLFRDYGYAAAVYFCVPDRQKEVLHYAHRALDEARFCRNTSGAQWVMSLVGILYKRNGDLGSAVDMYSSSFDEALEKNDTLGVANACNSLADLLLYWHLTDEANRYASRAVSIMGDARVSNVNPMVTGSIYVNKAKICKEQDKTDSALFFLDKAQPYCRQLPYNSGMSDIDLVRGTLYTRTAGGPMYKKGIGLLDKAARNGTSGIRSNAYFALAQAYAAGGSHARATEALDSLYAITQRNDFVIDGAYEFALNYALSTGNASLMKRFAKALCSDKRIDRRHEMIRKTSASIVKFDTDIKERELDLQASELHRKSALYLFIVLTSLMLMAVGGTVIFFKRRTYRMQQRLMEQKLLTVSNDLEQALHKAKMMTSRLEEMKQNTPGMPEAGTPGMPEAGTPGDAGTGPQKENVSIDIDRMRDDDGEARFRLLFEKAYPQFLGKLKTVLPNISRKEELLCMLIVLGKNSAQIENILCIARSSVNMARYRLRQKLGLTRNDSLDDFLKSMI